MRSEARTIEEYLEGLAPERREVLLPVLEVIRANLPAGYAETFAWGMITWSVPLAVYPDTYNGQPLMYAALAAQKSHYAVYLTSVYMEPGGAEAFEAEYRATGKRFDMGKSCVRFKKLDHLPLDLIGRTIASMPMDEFVAKAKAVKAATKKG